jgi:hypothetical protein
MSAPTYRLSYEADEVLGAHCNRLAARWGKPKHGIRLMPAPEPTDDDELNLYTTYDRAEARRFAALVRDARHYLGVHPHFGEDDPGADAKVVRQLRKLEDAVQADCGGIDSMQQLERWFRRSISRQANPWAALAVIAAAVVMVVWMVRSCG